MLPEAKQPASRSNPSSMAPVSSGAQTSAAVLTFSQGFARSLVLGISTIMGRRASKPPADPGLDRLALMQVEIHEGHTNQESNHKTLHPNRRLQPQFSMRIPSSQSYSRGR